MSPHPGAATLLIVDDEAYVRDSLEALLSRRGYDVRTADSVDRALERGQLEGVDLVLTDLKMPGRTGLDLVREIVGNGSQPAPPIIVLTAYGTVDSAVECLQAGAVDYLLKPANTDELVLTVERCLRQAGHERERNYLRSREGIDRADPIGVSEAWGRVVELAERAAETDAPVLLLGETGTGKEEIARLIHRRGARSGNALVSVNCAAIPSELFESELFGHRRGAFTGALSDREGRLRVADGGTLFLDEINSLPLQDQAKLLRVLEDGTFERVGDSQPTRVDVRLICASNADLEEEIAQGRFRADLFYRVNVVTISPPPLRRRTNDIAPLAEAFLAQAAARQGRSVHELPRPTLELLQAHSWPGNVRELRNVIERAVLLETGEQLQPDSLPPLSRAGIEDSGGALTGAGDGSLVLSEVKARAERAALLEALRRAGGVRREAARLLGVDERNLAYYLRKHDLMPPRAGRDDGESGGDT